MGRIVAVTKGRWRAGRRGLAALLWGGGEAPVRIPLHACPSPPNGGVPAAAPASAAVTRGGGLTVTAVILPLRRPERGNMRAGMGGERVRMGGRGSSPWTFLSIYRMMPSSRV